MMRLLMKLTRAAVDGDLPGWLDDRALSDQQELVLTILAGMILAVLVAGLSSIVAVAIDNAMPLDRGWLLRDD